MAYPRLPVGYHGVRVDVAVPPFEGRIVVE
jgi:hypothetical protein